MNRLQALTGAMVQDLPLLAQRPTPMPEIHMNVIYIHTPPVSIYHEYSFPVQLAEFEPVVELVQRAREVPQILRAMQSQLNRLHETLVSAPLLAAASNIFRELASHVRLDPEWDNGSLQARIYRIDGKHIECELTPHRILGSAYIREHPLTREELILWFSKPGHHGAMETKQWVSYLLGMDIHMSCEPQELLNYLAEL